MIDSLFKVLGSALSIWESKESRKYIDKLVALEKEYYAEINKDRPDMARLDIINSELRFLGEAFNSKVKASNSVDK